MHGFELVPVEVDDEGGVVGRAVVRPQPRPALVAAAGGHRRGVEGVDRGAARGAKREMETGAGRRGVARAGEERELVARPRRAEADARRARPDPPVAERREHAIIEGGGPREVLHSEGQMREHGRRAGLLREPSGAT